MGFVAVGSCGWLGVMVGMVVVGVEGHVPTCAVRVFDRILAWVIKILDQLQDPRKEVIKLLSEGRTLCEGQTTNLLCARAQLLEGRNTKQVPAKYESNGNLTAIQLPHQIWQLIWQLIGSLATQTNLQKTQTNLQSTQKKLNYLKQVLESRGVKLHSHKIF